MTNTMTAENTVATVDKSGLRVRRMFSEIAPNYDRMNHLLSMQVDRYWRWRTVRKVPPRGQTPILDLCTGTGDLALAYFRAGGGKVPVVGADFCPEMLSFAEKKRVAAGLSDALTFQEADAQNLPFPDNHFQIVSVAFGLRNVADTDQGLREMARVCQPGGKVAVLEFSMPRWQPFKAFYGWYFRHVLPRIGQFLARNSSAAYEYLPASVGEFPSYEQLVDRMLAAGLREAKFYPLTFGIATLYVGTK
jgi:demethylmenaquinone methyltransferase/2-methoxy-6-polyprenyl-1,4-benzoquinol methylase